MCGISGCVGDIGGNALRRLESMNESLAHRGPDDHGIIYLDEDGCRCVGDSRTSVGLAHRRLSIIDLSDAGKQPMTNEDESLWIVFNGECYNFQSLVADLMSCGHRFNSRSDTEALIHGYEEWGVEGLLSRINGMFAFALWDQKEQQLILARDRLGKKPLYYLIPREGSLVFASEIKALIAGGFVDTNDVDHHALVEFWLYGYNAGERTIFKQIRRVEPGCYAILKHGEFVQRTYWNLTFKPEDDPDRSLEDYCDELEELLLDSIKLRLISDVPAGVFLSSGIDSSLITSLTAKTTQQSIESFSIGFENAQFDESTVASEIAAHLGIRNTKINVNADFAAHFTFISRQFDELFGDSSAIPTFFVSREAKKHVTVVLTGDAGDELFAGYDSYAKALSLWGSFRQKWLLRKRTSLFQSAVDWLQLGLKRGEERFLALEMVMPAANLDRIFTKEFLSSIDMEELFYERSKFFKNVVDLDLLSAFQYLNIKTYLPDDILVKVDRMSMYHALECRSPFLDYRIVEFASRLPSRFKIGPLGERKYLLRTLLKRYLPEPISNRPKMGFSVPWSDWCSGAMRTSMIEKWNSMNKPYFRQEACGYLYPVNKPGWPARQWNAFCSMEFFKAYQD